MTVRSQHVILALALGLALWMMSEFVRVGSSSMPTVADRVEVGLMAVTPLLLVALAAAVAVIRQRTARLHAAVTGLLIAGLILGLVWAFALAASTG